MDYKKYDNSKALKVSRREIKYFIGVEDYLYFRSVFSMFLNSDKHNVEGGYVVRSLYFDSIDNIDFHDKLDGEKNRKKIRIRVYSPYDKVAKLEVKYKFNVNQRKESLSITREDAIEIISCNYSVLLKYNDALAHKVYVMMTTYLYKPVVTIEYKREAFFHNEYGIRSTLDTNITSSETDFNIFSDNMVLLPVFDITKPVLEVKYDKYLYSWFKDLLSIKQCTVSSISKYCHSRQFYENFMA